MIVFSSSISSSRFLSAAASRWTSSSLVGALTCAGPLRSVSTSLGAGFSLIALAPSAAGERAIRNAAMTRMSVFLLLRRAGHLDGVLVVANLVGPVLPVERPVLVP